MIFLKILAAIALTACLLLAYVRFAPTNTEKWHVDPTTIAKQTTQNSYQTRVSVENASLKNLEDAFLNIGFRGEKTRKLAGNLTDGFATYEVRTSKIGYPDYISARLVELDQDKSELVIFSRSRFGIRDFGQNAKRVSAWLARTF